LIRTGKEKHAQRKQQIVACVLLAMPFSPSAFLASPAHGKKLMTYRKSQNVFTQGDPCKGMYFIQNGRVKISVLSRQGKEAVVAILGAGDFMGESCLAEQDYAISSATAMNDASVLHIDRELFQRTLYSEPAFSEFFLRYVLSRNIHFEEDLIDQLFNSSEKRLARLLLMMARYGKPGDPEPTIPQVTQETLAEMVGTTRSRISKFMNKFRDLGFIDYDGRVTVNRSLLTVVLHDSTPSLPLPRRQKKKK
jgi:CRP/FNR family cyclic AMP-dependent transcriptional regulator